MSELLAAGDLFRMTRGTYVRVQGVVRSIAPLDSPFTGERVLGYDVACSVFTSKPPAYVSTARSIVWRDATLADDTGEIVLALERSRVRAPAGAESTIEDPAEIARMARKLSLATDPPPSQLQLLERSARHECVAIVSGVVDVLTSGAFRSSARPRVVLRGDRNRHLVIAPRG